ncbi:cyclin-domain-containing protein [Staphylotrichum tortipilum]|uniref:Cyclin-domain-containing protein n=1 Tax=Staphylotrichum tortipilum TaxID=2831512 RepID=A0AAN6RSS8_9PEZI|nr:cyclin-domain-containing protein [Staphylotrichum longicolle]
MMLARSPAPTPSANASPGSSLRNFHYAPAPAPAPSPRHSSSRVLAVVAKSRRPSSSPASTGTTAPATTAAIASQPPKRYVAVDAATQYSPMEPMDYATGALLPRVHHQPPTKQDLQHPSPRRKPMAAPDERPAAVAQPPPVKSVKAVPTGSSQRPADPSLLASPSKRRNSQGPGGSASALATAALQNPSTLAKRAKPDTLPPKVLPLRYELCAVEDVVVLIAHMLGELIETNDGLALKAGHLTRFHSRTAPGISVLDYLHRLAKHATLTPPLLLSMVYYIDRLCALYPDFTINTLTVHRFLITAATVAAKGLSDAFWNNSTYARVGGVKVAELKLLELEFLHRVDWKIVPNPEVLVAYYAGLVERCPGYTLETPASNGENPDASESMDDSDEIDDDDDDGGAEEWQGAVFEDGIQGPPGMGPGPLMGGS